jgi:hypothetical protein
MTVDDTNNTPTLVTGPLSVSASQVGKKCLDVVGVFRNGGCTALDKATCIQQVADILTSTTPQLSEAEVNDALGSYLEIIEQHLRTLQSGRSIGLSQPGAADEPSTGDKRGTTPECEVRTSKRAKVDEGEFPWIIRESLSGVELSDDLKKTLELLRTYAKDLKFTKSSILTSPHAPQFPNSEWTNIIIGAMVDLDHVISGSFAVSNDNWDVEVVGGIQFKFGAARASKHVKTSGDWFIAWNIYTKAVAFAFPHRQHELQVYGQHILGLFSATSVGNHSHILLFDKAVRVRVGEQRNLLLTNFAEFDDLRLYWFNPIGAGDPSKAKDKPKADFRSEEPCDRWNRGVCRAKSSECKYQHVCKECGGKHRVEDCKRSETGEV